MLDSCVQPVIQAVLVEPSEEVRLQLVQFMRALLKQAPRLIQAFASDVASILVAATFDSHPDVLCVLNEPCSVIHMIEDTLCEHSLKASMSNSVCKSLLIAVKWCSGGISSTGVVRRNYGVQVEARGQAACESLSSVSVTQPFSSARGCSKSHLQV